MKTHFETFARYNAWANARLYDAAAKLTADERDADAGVFFTSMTGTLNHILVADRIWMRRFTGTGDAPSSLDAVLFREFEALRTAREAEDARILDWIEHAALDGDFTYSSVRVPDRPITQALAPALAHMFNHQTHHRGQAHAILTRLTGDAPSLDMIYFLREPST